MCADEIRGIVNTDIWALAAINIQIAVLVYDIAYAARERS